MSPDQDVAGSSLAVRFASGERAGLSLAYDALAPQVRRWVRRFFQRPFEQEEAVQEVWLTAHRMQRQFDAGRAPLGAWLRALTANKCRELLRAQGRRPRADVPLDDVENAAWLDAESPEDSAFRSRAAAVLTRFIEGLPEEEAAVLKGALVEGQTHEELARALATSVRRSKYLKLKLLEKAARDPELLALAREWRGA
ncbi:MAG: RNA polymerase sigma factor [Myxococcaceae bacterium]|nr:RNA polymerase sigma factor [Myxococcaceae bacterium]